MNGPAASVIAEASNSDALYEFRSIPMEGSYPAVVLSPVLRWNMAFAVAMGSPDAPTAEQQDNARAFVDAFSAIRGRHIATRVWANKSQTSYSNEDAAALQSMLAASTVELPVKDSGGDSGVDGDIAAWVSGQSGELDVGEELVKGLNSAQSVKNNIPHPFNIATVLSQSAQFDRDIPSGGETMSVPYYKGKGLRGIRLDSSASDLSLYLFYGNSNAISQFHSGLTPAAWKKVTSTFRTQPANPPPLPLSVRERWGFRLTAFYKSYGCYFTEPGVENLTLNIDRKGMTLDATTAIEGFARPGARLDSLRLSRDKALVSPEQSVLFALVDRATGAFLVLGASTAT